MMASKCRRSPMDDRRLGASFQILTTGSGIMKDGLTKMKKGEERFLK